MQAILEHIDLLLERSSPIEVYHGTSTAFLREILKKGLIPNPSKQRWGQEMDKGRKALQPVATLDGHVYFSKSGFLAREVAEDAARKFGGNPLVVAAQIQPKSAKIDQAEFTSHITVEAEVVANRYAPSDARDELEWLLGYMMGVETAEQVRIGQRFAKGLQNAMGSEAKKAIKAKIPGKGGAQSDVGTALLMMYLTLHYRKSGGSASYNNGWIASQQQHWAEQGYDIDIPRAGEEWTKEDREEAQRLVKKTKSQWPRNLSTSELEDEWRDTIKVLSDRISDAIDSEGSRVRNIMIDDPVNFRGSNKIVAIVELDVDNLRAIVHYSRMPESETEKMIGIEMMRTDDVEFS